jgi:hypothetical protein
MDLQAGAPKSRPLSRRGRAWRLGAVLGALALLVYGSVRGSDDLFPFGPMAQYSFRISPDGEVRALWVDADLADGSHRRLDISDAGDLGVARAELEGQLDLIIADPQRLSELADAWARLHPDRPALTRIVVGQDVVHLHNGHESGRTSNVFTTWSASPAPGLDNVVPK